MIGFRRATLSKQIFEKNFLFPEMKIGKDYTFQKFDLLNSLLHFSNKLINFFWIKNMHAKVLENEWLDWTALKLKKII